MLNGIVDGVLERGWAVHDNFLSADEVSALRLELQGLDAGGMLTLATMHGQRFGYTPPQTKHVRQDRTKWLDGSTPAANHLVATRLSELREAFLSRHNWRLGETNLHYTWYPPGAFFKKHIDELWGLPMRRLVSVLIYLNDAWRDEDGGELLIYDSNNHDMCAATVIPRSGTLALFRTRNTPHEVKPTSRDRLAITGWFQTPGWRREHV